MAQENTLTERITSIDFFRGLTMFLLIGETSRFYDHVLEINNQSVHFVATQFTHHEWHGLHFWDLIQPFFMFIVGVAIPFAVANRKKKGESDRTLLLHAIKRSLLLLFLGWTLNCLKPGEIVFRFQNVLAQLSVTYLAAFLIRKKSFAFQVSFTLVILLATDLLYRFFPVDGFNHPWVAFENFGAWVNNKIEGVDSTNIWATFNAFPTIAHTVWGVLCGQLLMSQKSSAEKIRLLAIFGFSALAAGYALDLLGINPIIKKIATSSFVLASGGWAILALCFSYWLIDVRKKFIGGSQIFIVVGMNCIFIYVFYMMGGSSMLARVFTPFTKSLLSWSGELISAMVNSLLVWSTLWYICYWLFKRRVFIKI
jgi:predicted acyltransferase